MDNRIRQLDAYCRDRIVNGTVDLLKDADSIDIGMLKTLGLVDERFDTLTLLGHRLQREYTTWSDDVLAAELEAAAKMRLVNNILSVFSGN